MTAKLLDLWNMKHGDSEIRRRVIAAMGKVAVNIAKNSGVWLLYGGQGSGTHDPTPGENLQFVTDTREATATGAITGDSVVQESGATASDEDIYGVLEANASTLFNPLPPLGDYL